ncbi:uncharacterized protein EAF01_010769 [Botrytis porri]|uniref:uncharacterized protein n=1 Tax=Botrytis porri TaxID=87229 RepID=UPI0019011B5A|nr:uncharacterized protein EAF01_010769 [Botrytis porri]KAF7889276.1 hypothetical protein EAF01_010769 [Botrytis porri]
MRGTNALDDDSIYSKLPSEIADLRRKAKAADFKAMVLERIKLFKIVDSQGTDVSQSDRVAASKLLGLDGNAPEEGKTKTDVLKKKMTLEREIAELMKRKAEFANQFRILNEKLEERLEEVARKEEFIDGKIKKWTQKNFTAHITERSQREKGALQEAESAALFRREEEMHEREAEMHRREAEMLRREEEMHEREAEMLRREMQVIEEEQSSLRVQRSREAVLFPFF